MKPPPGLVFSFVVGGFAIVGCSRGTLKPYETTQGMAGEPGSDPETAGAAGAAGASGDTPAGAAGARARLGGTAGAAPSAEGGAAGAPEGVAVSLTADDDGWVDRKSNSLGIQGLWNASMGADATVEMTVRGAEVCLKGDGGELLGDPPDFEAYWGAAAAIEICREGSADAPDDTHTLSTCPWSPDLANEAVGVRFTLEATQMPWAIWVEFREKNRDSVPYVSVNAPGEIVALFKDALVPWDSSAPPPSPEDIESIWIHVPPGWQQTQPFDFCIKNFEMLQGNGWKSSGVPDWALEPGPGRQVDFVGVNLAGAEFGQDSLPGTYGTDYIYPGESDVAYYADAGMNIIRLPFRWERLEPELGEALDATELARIAEVVDYASGRGMSVILDPHNFARYGDAVIGVDVEIDAFASFWGRLAEQFADKERVIFGLMNEPHDMDTKTWLEAANAATAAIRAAGADQLILVPGNGWSGAHNWTASYYGASNGTVMADFEDPGDHFAFELHQYLDADSSGTGNQCSSENIGVERVKDATEWMREGGYRAFLGEFGAPANDTCLKAMDNLLAYVGENDDVWMGWTVWAGGPWWGDSPLSVEPMTNGEERPQMVVLRRHVDAP